MWSQEFKMHKEELDYLEKHAGEAVKMLSRSPRNKYFCVSDSADRMWDVDEFLITINLDHLTWTVRYKSVSQKNRGPTGLGTKCLV